jgi:hypothetical protein
MWRTFDLLQPKSPVSWKYETNHTCREENRRSRNRDMRGCYKKAPIKWEGFVAERLVSSEMRLTDQQRNAFDIEAINLPTKYRERGTDWMCRRRDRVAKNNLCLSTQQFLSNPLLLAGKSLPITIRVPALRLDRPPNLDPAFRRA